MESGQYIEFIQKRSRAFDILRKRQIYLIGRMSHGALLQDLNFAEINSSCFIPSDLEIIQVLMDSVFIRDYPFPVLIEIPKAVSLYRQNRESEKGFARCNAESALLLSRVSFPGTDGMRGKVYKRDRGTGIRDFTAENLLGPDLIRLSSQAYGEMLLDAGHIQKGETACVGHDGRDRTSGWKLKEAMIQGFRSAGLRVCDIGEIPTPYVPWMMLRSSYAAGAMLTASHNPANQNGIKFFLHGLKNLPEGECGDYSLTARIFGLSLEKERPQGGTEVLERDINREAEDFLLETLPPGLFSGLNHPRLILDNANGAYSRLGSSILDRLQADYICVNEEARGENINRECGVAQIEGRDEIGAPEYGESIRVVREVFDQGRKGGQPVYGIVLDGDGDRGFVLFYHKERDSVLVLDGDRSGYLIAAYLIRSRGVDPGEYSFVLTVESDLMTSLYAEENLGLQSHIVSVGDKWICRFAGGKLLVGLESSGHLIVPLPVRSREGETHELRTGNGLLTALLLLRAIGDLKLSAEELRTPYSPGFSRTLYTYFVDKTLFYRDSPVWQEDLRIIENGVNALIESGRLPADCRVITEEKEDPHMLYTTIKEGETTLASLFCRNSGTEDKTAVYLKCREERASLFLPIARQLGTNHTEKLKNRNREEYGYEQIILRELANERELSLFRLKQLIEREHSSPVEESDMDGVLYALKKEERVIISNSLVRLNRQIRKEIE